MAARCEGTIALTDGRTLGYAEYGDPGGRPLFLFHGTPGSRLAVEFFWPDAPGPWRVIAPDRPGLGFSTVLPKRKLLDWPDDVRQLADHLEVDRFWVAGVSGGACHALACAYVLRERVVAVASVCGGAPLETAADLRAMHGPNRATFRIARAAPFALYPLLALARFANDRFGERFADATPKGLPEGDVAALRDPRLRELVRSSTPEQYRQGLRGIVADVGIQAAPWGFDPAQIGVPVLQFHGEEDQNAPVGMARRLAAVIPNTALTVYPGEGHLIVPKHWHEITAALAAAA